MKQICVLGSMNMDIVLNVNRMPKVGETILSNTYTKVPGGKGANQAVAAKRLGANVFMIAKLGKDENGRDLLASLENDDINTEYVFHDEENPTGMAMITVDGEGNNSIVVVSGSNMNISKKDIRKAESVIQKADVLIAQLETPIEATIEAFKIAKESGVTTILNPAPARELPDEVLKLTDIIVPNETEIFELTNTKVTDLESAKKGAEGFFDKGVSYVIVTLGSNGAALLTKERGELIQAYKVNAVDTTAAGDGFIGALASQLSDKKDLYEALKEGIKFANQASSIVVQRKGAQPSLPTLKEVLEVYGEESK